MEKVVFVGANGTRYSSKFYYVFDGFIYLKVSDSKLMELIESGAGNTPVAVLKCVEKQRGIQCTK